MPLPFRIWLLLTQLVTVSLNPPYQFIVLAAEVPPFMTVHIAPHLLAALTYLKQVAVVVMLNEPPPVIVVQVPPLTGVFVRVAVGQEMAGSMPSGWLMVSDVDSAER